MIQEKISEKEIYNNTHKKILLRTFRTKDWTEKEIPIYSNAESVYWTMVLVLDEEKNIYYWKEYRDWPEIFVNNFSVWKHEKELSFEENALKELEEELWMKTDDLIYLWESISWNYDTWILKYFIWRNCIKTKQKLEPWENFEIKKCSIDEFEEKIISWEINCPLTITCYTLAKFKNLI